MKLPTGKMLDLLFSCIDDDLYLVLKRIDIDDNHETDEYIPEDTIVLKTNCFCRHGGTAFMSYSVKNAKHNVHFPQYEFHDDIIKEFLRRVRPEEKIEILRQIRYNNISAIKCVQLAEE